MEETKALKQKIFENLLKEMGINVQNSEQTNSLAEAFYDNLDRALALRLMQLLEGNVNSTAELEALAYEDIQKELEAQNTSIEQIMTLEAAQLAAEIKSAVEYSRGYLDGMQDKNQDSA